MVWRPEGCGLGFVRMKYLSVCLYCYGVRKKEPQWRQMGKLIPNISQIITHSQSAGVKQSPLFLQKLTHNLDLKVRFERHMDFNTTVINTSRKPAYSRINKLLHELPTPEIKSEPVHVHRTMREAGSSNKNTYSATRPTHLHTQTAEEIHKPSKILGNPCLGGAIKSGYLACRLSSLAAGLA